MLHRLRPRSVYDVFAALALFFALAGGSAYALSGSNTVFNDDIVNDEVTTADVRNDNLGFGGLYQQDLGPNSVASSEIASGAVGSSEVQDNSLTGADVNESSFNLPPTTTATFAGQGNVNVTNSFSQIVAKNLPAGTYAIAATANIAAGVGGADAVRDTFCELRNPSGAFIGGGRDRRYIPANSVTTISLSMNGGVTIPSGGGNVSLHCRFEGGNSEIGDGQMMIIRLDGFF